MPPRFVSLSLLLACSLSGALQAATVSSPSVQWVAISGNYDYTNDQQTGVTAGDIVGLASDPGFLTTFNDNGQTSHTDGMIGFRVRLDSPGGKKGNPVFDRVLWVGIDADLNGSVDVFLGANFQGSNASLGIYDAGSDLNTSPSTTSVASTAAYTYTTVPLNYNYRAVDYLTDGGTTNDITPATSGDPDQYVSFLIPFQDVVSFLSSQGHSLDDTTALRYVVATSTQPNSLNQDLGGVNGGINSSSTWTSLGGFSPAVRADGTMVAVPEPSVLGLLGLVPLVLGQRRRQAVSLRGQQ